MLPKVADKMNITKNKELFALIVSVGTALIMAYQMLGFISRIDYRIEILEKSNQELRNDIKSIVKEQSKSINRNNTELKIFAASTDARLKNLEKENSKEHKR